jgi:hypothetical protein
MLQPLRQDLSTDCACCVAALVFRELSASHLDFYHKHVKTGRRNLTIKSKRGSVMYRKRLGSPNENSFLY